ncbi:MAG: hypothetical protein CVV03_12725 [Firmicutes bacterium HGW-Firmicutes-8]|nr:MAG: hypothetical protein CVV03_12725 [Firmicutes bacterium HGW-Firmicutes-8]
MDIKNDRSVAGAIAGLVGSIIQEMSTLIIKYLGFSDKSFIDYSSVMVMFHRPNNFMELVVAWTAHFAVGITLGLLFVQVFMITSAKYLFLKGIFYGFVLWFILLGLGTVFRLPEFTSLPWNVAMTTFIGSLVWSLSVAYILRILEKTTLI